MAELFPEIFQATSVGDIGIEVANGPLFRCHSHILETEAPGFLAKCRLSPSLNRSVSELAPAITIQDAVARDPKLKRLKADLEFTRFSEDVNMSRVAGHRGNLVQELRSPGYSTATKVSGTIGSIRNRDIFFLAERYEVHEPLERIVELLRYIYRKNVAYFSMIPKTPEEKEDLQKSMIDMLYLSDKYCVDALLTDVIEWIRTKCRNLCGDVPFGDACYQTEYYCRERCQEPIHKAQLRQLVLDLSTDRQQLRVITKDERWMSLSFGLLEDMLSLDAFAIGSEDEIMGLIERWNGNADKNKAEIAKLLNCYRVCEKTWDSYLRAFQNLGWPPPSKAILSAPGRKQPRDNLSTHELTEMMEEFAAEKQRQKMAAATKRREERDQLFIAYDNGERVQSGFAFCLVQGRTIMQNVAVRAAGSYRARVAFSQSVKPLWDPTHELFTGIIFGENRYLGYICGQSPYDGVFRLQSFRSGAPKPGAPVHFTGSGTKMEFDVELGVSIQRVNEVVDCSLSILSNNTVVSLTDFQVQNSTLLDGTGLRFQIMGTIPPPGSIDVNIAWVGGV